jgi:hypothetical protein
MMVDLVGFEPTTSSMSWKSRTCRPLILKVLMTVGVGRNRRERRTLLPNCYQNYRPRQVGFEGCIVGDQPSFKIAAEFIQRHAHAVAQ